MIEEVIYNTTELASYSSSKQKEPEYNPYSLVNQNDPILLTALPDFDFGDPKLDCIEIASRLVETAKFHKAFGISANQCGLPYKVCVVGNEDQYVAFFNPVIISESGEVNLPEVDLSNMGLQLHIKRPKIVHIQYQDYNGETKLIQLDGITSRIVQQNIDRLNGIDFKTKVSQFNLDRKKKSLTKKVKRFIKQNTIMRKSR